MQSILDSWLTGDSKKKLYNVFYLDWMDTEQPKSNALWLDNVPINVNIKKKVHFKKLGIDVLVCGNINIADKLKQYDFDYTPLLKSNLQKCIRRGLLDKSLGTAKVMIKTDFLDFVRRLSIIILEDVTLHQSFNILMWMIAAYPEWKPNKIHINWLLTLVKHLVNVKERDNYLKEEFDFNSRIKEINNLNQLDRSMIYCLEFRKSYGGMKGDLLMIQYLTNMWIDRFKNRSYLNYVYQNIEFDTLKVSNIKINEIELSAVDFHCFPGILNLVFNRHPKYDFEDIKKAIWFFRSRNNFREIINPELVILDESINYQKIWNDIEQDVKFISKGYLKKFN